MEIAPDGTVPFRTDERMAMSERAAAVAVLPLLPLPLVPVLCLLHGLLPSSHA